MFLFCYVSISVSGQFYDPSTERVQSFLNDMCLELDAHSPFMKTSQSYEGSAGSGPFSQGEVSHQKLFPFPSLWGLSLSLCHHEL